MVSLKGCIIRLGEILKGIWVDMGVLRAQLIIFWPDTSFGLSMRQRYYLGKNRVLIKYVGRGVIIDRAEAVTLGEDLILGANVKLIISGMAKCFIGSQVSIADDTYIRSANHIYADTSRPIQEQGHTWKRIRFQGEEFGIVIEDDVWIGAKSIILSGAHIGKGSIVSAGSVVSVEVPPYSIVAGNPARVILNRLNLAKFENLGENKSG
jgi:acetyltransferase-like isoleucine patch superfamily enzyme